MSHPAVVIGNQDVYAELVDLGWDVQLIVPDRWRHEYSPATFAPARHPRLDGRVHPLPVVAPGAVQRHVYRVDPRGVLRRHHPDVVFLEEEYYSVPAAQWGLAASVLGIPFGVQADENLDRPLPAPARALRRLTLARASFVAARSPTAAHLARRWGAPARSAVVPHSIPQWRARPARRDDVFTVGYVGRLVPEKGIADLLAAMRRVGPPARLLVVGDGPERATLTAAAGTLPAPGLEHHRGATTDQMPAFYAQMDVLVLPSRTTPTWAEQFGRVLVEALSCGVPVIGTDSGEIGWVIAETGGGRVVPEGDVAALAGAIVDVRSQPEPWRRRAETGRHVVDQLFSAPAAAGALDRLLRRSLR